MLVSARGEERAVRLGRGRVAHTDTLASTTTASTLYTVLHCVEGSTRGINYTNLLTQYAMDYSYNF